LALQENATNYLHTPHLLGLDGKA